MNNNKDKYRYRLAGILLITITIIFAHIIYKNQLVLVNQPISTNEQEKIEKISDFLISTASDVPADIDNRDLYTFACSFCDFTVSQYEQLIEAYPDKYKNLKDKLGEYDREKILFDMSTSDVELWRKAQYAETYIKSLLELTQKLGLDKDIKDDYEKIIK